MSWRRFFRDENPVTAARHLASPQLSVTSANPFSNSFAGSCILRSRMSTPKQIAASRANGAKSKGPATPEGKLISSRNSTRHGLFAENVVLETEKTGAFLELVESLFEEHNPRTPTQKLLVENIAAARWRQWRIWGMEKVAFDDEVAAPSITDDPPLRAVLAWKNSADSMRVHELLLRYEIALDRQISRSLLRLLQLQAQELQRVERTEPNAAPPPASEHESEPQPKSVDTERTRQTMETIVPPTASSVANPRPDSGPAAHFSKTGLPPKKGATKSHYKR